MPGAGTSGALARWGVTRATESGEDLPADRIVPVAEGAAACHRVARPRAAAQHLVPWSEEDLGVLPVGERGESRVPHEVAGRPFPHLADELPDAVRGGARRVAAGPGGPQVRAAEVCQL